MNNNHLKLPSIVGNSRFEEVERKRFNELSIKYQVIKSLDLVNTGDLTAILCSNTDGYGRFSEEDSEIFLDAGNFYTRMFKGDASSFSKSRLFKNATSKDLFDVIQEPKFKNILVIGHSNYHNWRASDMPVDWYDLGEKVKDHLKDGIFMNLGCGGLTSWNKIPLGYFIVNDHSNLYGKKAEDNMTDKLKDPSQLVRLNPRI